MTKSLGLGGGCHWCTEAVFQSLKGVQKVEQGWIASTGRYNTWSEAIIVHFNTKIITVSEIIMIHLHSHSASSDHSMREKYRSAIYYFHELHKDVAEKTIKDLEQTLARPIGTLVLPFEKFKLNQEKYIEYYRKNPEKPFCQTYITPKLNDLKQQFPDMLHTKKTLPISQ